MLHVETLDRSKCVSRPLFQNQFSKQMEIKVNYKRKPFLSSAVLTEKMTNWIKDNHLEILTKTYVIYNYNRWKKVTNHFNTAVGTDIVCT